MGLFSTARLLGTPERELELSTRLGTHIDNGQTLPGEVADVARLWSKMLAHLKPSAQIRRRPCGIYNCFGLVWASRRTGIFEQSQLETIIEEDGYKEVDLENADVGDVVLYYTPEGRIVHGALVVGMESIGSTQIPLVLSKLSSNLGEVLHLAPHYRVADSSARYFTDRTTV